MSGGRSDGPRRSHGKDRGEHAHRRAEPTRGGRGDGRDRRGSGPSRGPARAARPDAPARPPAQPTVMRAPADAREPMRLQRFLARAGVASRRQAETLIATGSVLVNGVAATIGQVVDPARDAVTIDGRRVQLPTTVTWMVLHKPPGYMTTRVDPEGRPTVFELVPDAPGLTYVGRLDFLTEGVLLLTTDGTAAHQLTHPSRELPRTYVADVHGDGPAAIRMLEAGVELDDGLVDVQAAEVEKAGRGKWVLTLTLHEGRNREVRRVCEAVGLQVDRLVRVAFGPIALGSLAPGAWRPLTPAELRGLAARTGR